MYSLFLRGLLGRIHVVQPSFSPRVIGEGTFGKCQTSHKLRISGALVHYPCVLLNPTASSSSLIQNRATTNTAKRARAGCILYPINRADGRHFKMMRKRTNNMSSQLKQNVSTASLQFSVLSTADECSEAHFYTDSNFSWRSLIRMPALINQKKSFSAQVFGECDQSPHFKEMSP